MVEIYDSTQIFRRNIHLELFRKFYQNKDEVMPENPLLTTNSANTEFTFDLNIKSMKDIYDQYLRDIRKY